MYKLICGNCERDLFENINPDETKCLACGHIHEKLSDYSTVQMTDEYFAAKEASK